MGDRQWENEEEENGGERGRTTPPHHTNRYNKRSREKSPRNNSKRASRSPLTLGPRAQAPDPTLITTTHGVGGNGEGCSQREEYRWGGGGKTAWSRRLSRRKSNGRNRGNKRRGWRSQPRLFQQVTTWTPPPHRLELLARPLLIGGSGGAPPGTGGPPEVEGSESNNSENPRGRESRLASPPQLSRFRALNLPSTTTNDPEMTPSTTTK
jgi:hypothetical protein